MNGQGESWDLWKNIAKQAKHDEYGHPDVFCSDTEATNWMSATVETSNEDIIQHIMNICKRDPRAGKVTTGGIVTVKDSVNNWFLSWTINRQPQFRSQNKDTVLVWLYALHTDTEGNYIKKTVRNGFTILVWMKARSKTIQKMHVIQQHALCLISMPSSSLERM